MRLVGFNGDLSASNRVGKGNTYPSAIYASIGGFERIRRPWPKLNFVHFPHEGKQSARTRAHVRRVAKNGAPSCADIAHVRMVCKTL